MKLAVTPASFRVMRVAMEQASGEKYRSMSVLLVLLEHGD
jgi:hypothetical protein